MTPSDKKSRRSALFGAGLFFVIGLVAFFEGHNADVHHTVVPGSGPKAAWMYPWQAYLAAAIAFVASGYALFLAFRKRSVTESSR